MEKQTIVESKEPMDQDDLLTLRAAARFAKDKYSENADYFAPYGDAVSGDWLKDLTMISEKVDQAVEHIDEARKKTSSGSGVALIGLTPIELVLLGISLEFARDLCVAYEFCKQDGSPLPMSATTKFRDQCEVLNQKLLMIYRSKLSPDDKPQTVH